MSQQINLQISDEVYAGLQREASEMGLSTAEWIAADVILSKKDIRLLSLAT